MFAGIVFIVKFSITIDGNWLNVYKSLDRLDLIHMLAWQKLQFCYQIQVTT